MGSWVPAGDRGTKAQLVPAGKRGFPESLQIPTSSRIGTRFADSRNWEERGCPPWPDSSRKASLRSGSAAIGLDALAKRQPDTETFSGDAPTFSRWPRVSRQAWDTTSGFPPTSGWQRDSRLAGAEVAVARGPRLTSASGLGTGHGHRGVASQAQRVCTAQRLPVCGPCSAQHLSVAWPAPIRGGQTPPAPAPGQLQGTVSHATQLRGCSRGPSPRPGRGLCVTHRAWSVLPRVPPSSWEAQEMRPDPR